MSTECAEISTPPDEGKIEIFTGVAQRRHARGATSVECDVLNFSLATCATCSAAVHGRCAGADSLRNTPVYNVDLRTK